MGTDASDPTPLSPSATGTGTTAGPAETGTTDSVLAELTVVRHGQSVANAALAAADAQGLVDAGLTGRDADIELTDLGREQAAALGRWLTGLAPQHRPEIIICSPYLRARRTWQIAAETSGLPLPSPSTDDRLVDRLAGELELLTTAAIAHRFPAEAARIAITDELLYQPPGGETFGDVAARLTSFLRDVNRRHTGRRVLVVAHDAVVLMLRGVIEGLELSELSAIVAQGRVRNASITRFDGSTGRLVLAEYNAVGHLGQAVPSVGPRSGQLGPGK